MTKNRARSPKPQVVRPRRSQLILTSLVLCGASTLLTLIVLRWCNVALGQQFNYRYSQLAELKTATGLWPIALIALLVIRSARWIVQPNRRGLGLSVGMLSIVLLALWTAFAIPRPIRQHSVNLVSPSHDGAFVLEANEVKSLPDYLRRFNQYIQRPVSAMGGTRILANPPGLTILAVAERRIFPVDQTWNTPIERYLTKVEDIQEDDATFMFAHGLRFGMILLALWALSAPLAYLLGRQFMAPLGAALFALLVTFNPCTAHFSPGKDAAQLLTVNAMLLAWFVGARRDRMSSSALAGALLLIGAICGLIHFWVAVTALVVSVWQAWSDGSLRNVLKHAVAATVGFLLLAAIVYFASGWNCITTLIATGRLYNKVKNTIGINETLWLFIGLPIFLLFITPAFWTSAMLMFRKGPRRFASRFRKSLTVDLRNRQATSNTPHDGGACRNSRPLIRAFGTRLLICVVASMALSYTLGVSWELPRVWIAYLPLLFLAVMIDVPLFRFANRRALRPILTIAIASLAFTAIQWTLLDVRESEYRAILTERAWY